MTILIEVSPGELVDKLTILEIKLENISDAAKLSNIRREYEMLHSVFQANLRETAELTELTARLKETNLQLWKIEDDIRDHDRRADFGEMFVKLARSAYRTNDVRAVLKRRVCDLFDSRIVEEKSYSAY